MLKCINEASQSNRPQGSRFCPKTGKQCNSKLSKLAVLVLNAAQPTSGLALADCIDWAALQSNAIPVVKLVSVEKGSRIENADPDTLPGFTHFKSAWKSAVADDQICRFLKQVTWEVDVYNQVEQTERATRWHSHPMPLLLVQMHATDETSTAIDTSTLLTTDGAELLNPPNTFLPLAGGTVHKEGANPDGRLFISFIPHTHSLRRNRSLRRKNASQRTIDTNDNTVAESTVRNSQELRQTFVEQLDNFE